ncbi:polysialyltransferase family glycosyltransferase [Teredinibacter franksiae]|uniref:polysialyltransferase family glycosyltransferase n=1 Tax=Teredinibacter franksiae TaxID=2761453 RepID=UPI001623ACEB|nr:polysialyltransferase family glycosyltransferase [Teredinibacter franksiae]
MKPSELIVGCVSSSFQLLNFITFLESKKKYLIKSHVVIKGYWGGVTIQPSYISYCKELGVEILFADGNSKSLADEVCSIISSESACLHKISVVSANRLFPMSVLGRCFRLRSEIQFVFIEDGIGAYGGFRHIFSAILREKGRLSKSAILFPFAYVTNQILSFFYNNKRFLLFEDNDVNVSVDYKEAFVSVVGNLESAKRKRVTVPQNSIIFCSQPYVDMGLLSELEYAGFIKKINLYAENNACNFIVKRHPADNKFNYDGMVVVEGGHSFEELLFQNKENIYAVASINSTCLITASAIFGIKSLSIQNNLAELQFENFPCFMKAIFNRYVEIKYERDL